MEYREIVAITGMGGLFQLLATKSDGAIVRNLADKTTKFIAARVHNVTPLESIEIYTTGANVRLHEVLKSMQDNEAKHPIVDHKVADNATIKNYLKAVFPDLDEERVYVSDMKKMLRWYELLKANDLLKFEEPKQEEQEEREITPATEDKPTKAAKKAPKKAAEPEDKPAKKAAAKKKASTGSPHEEVADKPAAKKAAAKKAIK